MKKIDNIRNTLIIALIFSFTLNACDDFLTKNPVDSLAIGNYWKTEDDLKSWNAGIYNALQSALASNMLIWGESRADDFYDTSYGGSNYVLNLLDDKNSYANWEALYQVINRCNIMLEKVETIPEVSDNTKRYYKGQALGIRALMYFYGVRVWGRIPKVTISWDGTEKNKYKERASIEDICSLIESDINESLKNLEGNTENVYYFGEAAAYALQIEYNMYRKDYEKAISVSDMYLQLVKTKKSYVIGADTWRKIFLDPSSSKETIFSLHWDFSTNGANPYGAIASSPGSPNTLFRLSNNVWRLMLADKNDVRFWGVVDTLAYYNDMTYGAKKQNLTIENGPTASTTALLLHMNDKFYELNTANYSFSTQVSSQCSFKLPIYRHADVMLLRAEALNKLGGNDTEVFKIINDIRLRCGNKKIALAENYPIRDGWIDGSREKLILQERQLEFYGEGKRYFDLMRTGLLKVALDEHYNEIQSNPTGFDEARTLWPVYYKVFSSNPSLQGDQNSPY